MRPLRPVRFDSIVSLKVAMECYDIKEGSQMLKVPKLHYIALRDRM
jgi:hypothetical protein